MFRFSLKFAPKSTLDFTKTIDIEEKGVVELRTMKEADTSLRENKKSLSPLVIAAGVFVLGDIAFLYILNAGKSSRSSVGPPVSNQVELAGVPTGPVKEFTVDGSNFEFDPDTITVKEGDTVKITFKDNDSRHSLVIDGYNVSTDIIGKGKEDTIQFAADKVGAFEYYCSVANHRELGMTGTFIVEEVKTQPGP